MEFFKINKQIILASASPRRKELLSSVGLDFTICPAKCEEPAPNATDTPANYALKTALLKSRDVAHNNLNSIIIGADTVVAINNTILGKPKNNNDALRMLQLLNGKEHSVITGCAIINSSTKQEFSFYNETKVTFSKTDESVLMQYIKTKEPNDKAGSYAIQGIGSFLVKKIEGSYTNVVGLPLNEVLSQLLELNVIKTI